MPVYTDGKSRMAAGGRVFAKKKKRLYFTASFTGTGSGPPRQFAQQRIEMQRAFGTVAFAFHTDDALRAVFPAPGIVGHIHFPGADLFALAAGNAFFRITLDPHAGIIAGGFQEHRDGADVFAEGAVVLEQISEGDTDGVIQHVTDDQGPEHNVLHVADMGQEQRADKDQG